MKFRGKVWKFGDNIDTDAIIPARHLTTTDPAELARHCMEDLDAQFAGNVGAGDIIVAGENFGCGSSREHAPIAIQAAGIACVVARSFARIFYRNAFNMGLPIFESAQLWDRVSGGQQIEVDGDAGRIVIAGSEAAPLSIEPIPPFMQELIRDGGLMRHITLKKQHARKEMMDKKVFRIAVFPGDGIGPEVVREALKCLAVISETSGISFQPREGLIGGAATDACGMPLPESSLALARASDAVLLGAVGGPKWEALSYDLRPERALLGLREKLGLFANLRPVVAHADLIDASPLKTYIVQNIDILIVRELTGDAYFGNPRGIRIEEGQRVGVNTIIYTEQEIRRIAKVAFDLAMTRGRKLCSVDKANVLESTQLWRDVVTETGRDYPEVSLSHMYVDNCAMQLIRNPAQFDVIVTTNMFGDILSDEASMLTGSIGMLPSASLGERAALYEPIHGSAPDIAGQDLANPLGMILSAAMMLRISFGMEAEGKRIEEAVRSVLKEGLRTRDIHQDGKKLMGTTAMGEGVAKHLRALLTR